MRRKKSLCLYSEIPNVLQIKFLFICISSFFVDTKSDQGGAAIAQWIHPRLPSCRHRFESQSHHLHFFSIYIVQTVYLSIEFECEKNENNKKSPGLAHFFKKKLTNQNMLKTGLTHKTQNRFKLRFSRIQVLVRLKRHI